MGITLSIIAHELEPIGDVLGRSTPLELFEDVRLLDDSADLQERDESLLFVCDDTDLAVEASARGTSVLYLAPTGEEDRSYRGEVCALFGGPPLLDTFSFLQRVFLKYRLWQNDLDRSCLADEGIQRLLDLSEQFLVNNVVVVDPALKLLAYTRGIECDDPITVELIAHGYHTEDNIRKFRLNKRFKPWATESGFIVNDTYEICKYVTVAHSFKTRDSFSLIAIMMCNNTAPADYLLDAFSMVLKRVSYYAKRDYPEGKPSGNVVDSFLRDLVEGRIKSEAAIRERCEFAGIPYNARFCLFSINASPEAAPVSRLASDVAREVAPAKTLIADREIIVLCFNCRSNACSAHCC